MSDQNAEPTKPDQAPIVEFYSIYQDIRAPEPASRDLRGSLPSRAVKLCTPITSASSFGWYIYPPIDFAVRWTGSETEWSVLEENEPVEWRSLAGGYDAKLPFAKEAVAQIPESRKDDFDVFDSYGGAPPFIDADPRGPERVEIITGILARTQPGWLLHVREAPNWPRIDGIQVYEGLVECEWYRSYLPTIVRLTTQNKIVRFHKDLPLICVQAIPASVLAANQGPAPTYAGMADIPDEVWDEFVAWRRDRDNPDTPATYVRRQRDQAQREARVR